MTLLKSSPIVGELSPGMLPPPRPVSTSGSAPETSCTAVLAMLVTTASFMVVVPRSVWSGLSSPLLWVSVTVSSFYRFYRILP